jgi:WD40 repeat protein
MNRFTSPLLLAFGVLMPTAALAQSRPVANPPSAPADVREALPPGALARLGTMRQRIPATAQVAIRPDGRTFVTVVDGRLIGEWDTATGAMLRQKRLPGELRDDFVLAPNGKLLAVGDEGGVGIWDLAKGTRQRLLQTPVDRMVFSADGKQLATMAGDKKHFLDVWNVEDGTKRRLATLTRYARALAFAPDGKRLFAATDDDLYCWDANTLRRIWCVEHAADGLIVSPDGKKLFTVDYLGRGTVRLWNAVTGNQEKKLVQKNPELAWAQPLAFLPDGKSLLLNSFEGPLVWDTSGEEARPFHAGAKRLMDSFALAPDGKTALTVIGSLLQRWDLTTGRILYPDTTELGHANPVVALAFAPDGRTLATSSSRDTIRLWDLAKRQPRTFPARTQKGISRYVTFRPSALSGIQALPILAFTPDGRKLLVEGEKERLSLRRVDTGEETFRLDVCPKRDKRIGTARLTPDGRTIWTWSYDSPQFESTIRLNHSDILSAWDAASGRRLSSRTILRMGEVEARHISPDGRYAALVCHHILDATTGKPYLRDVSDPGRFRCFAFSSDSRLIAAANPQDSQPRNEVHVFELLTGREVACLSASLNGCSSLAFSPDGRLLVAAGNDALDVWDIAAGRRVLHLPAEGRLPNWVPSHFATCLAVAPDGRSAATGHDDGVIFLWDLAPAWQRLAAPREKLSPDRQRACWNDLVARDPKTAYKAMNLLLTDAPATVPFLGERLRVEPIDAEAVRGWLRDLDADDFAARERASRELGALVDRIEPRLQKALKNTTSLEVRRRLLDILKQSSEAKLSLPTVRQLRAVAVLEQIATPEARRALQTVSQSEAAKRVTAAATDALRRLNSPK